jgi:Reverse transcriptase (RNA-dependent DNA polymerase)
MPLFASAQVLATRKSNGGARPIAIGNTTRRAILKALIQKVTPVAAENLAPHQLAVGVKSGCDVVAHEVRTVLEKYGQDDGRAFLRIDAENAFNKVSRAAMLDGVLTHAPGTARKVYADYSQPPLLKAGAALFTSREGAQQGCQLSMIMCCVGEHPTVEKIEAKCNLDVNLWIAEDGSLYGKIDRLLAIDILEAEETTG